MSKWKEFRRHLKKFKEAGVKLMGIRKYSHFRYRKRFLRSLLGIRFPIICDKDGDFSRAFGVLKISKNTFGAVRALVVLNPDMKMIHISLNNEKTT